MRKENLSRCWKILTTYNHCNDQTSVSYNALYETEVWSDTNSIEMHLRQESLWTVCVLWSYRVWITSPGFRLKTNWKAKKKTNNRERPPVVIIFYLIGQFDKWKANIYKASKKQGEASCSYNLLSCWLLRP